MAPRPYGMATITHDLNDRVAELHDQLEAAFQAMTTGEDWQRMLEVASRFHDYSLNNLLLILWQRPDATRVAGYRKWQELGRQVRRGERSIRIFAPVRRWVEDEDDDGAPIRVQRVVAFKAVSVFDVSQTDGEPLPDVDRPRLLSGEAPAGLWDALAAQVAEQGFGLDRADCTPANGVTRWDTRTVTVRPDVDDAQAVRRWPTNWPTSASTSRPSCPSTTTEVSARSRPSRWPTSCVTGTDW